MGFVIQRYDGHSGVRAGALPCHTECFRTPGNLQHYVCAAMIAVCQNKFLNRFRPHCQHLGIVFLDKCQPLGIFFADNHPLWLLQQNTLQCTDASGTRADDQYCVCSLDFRNICCPIACCKDVPHKQRLLVCHCIRNPVQALVCIGNADILRLPTINAAPQRPATVGVGTIVDPAVFTKKAFSAEGFHVYRHPVTGPDAGHGATGFHHHAHHLMPHRDARHSAGNAVVLDVEVAGADARKRHPDNGIPAVQQNRLWFVQKLKFSFSNISVGQHCFVPHRMNFAKSSSKASGHNSPR